MPGCGVCVVVVIESMIGAVRDENVPGDILSVAKLDKVLGSETVRLKVCH
jgi:hypothetical protein